MEGFVVKGDTLKRLFVEYSDPGLLDSGDVPARLARQDARLEALRRLPGVVDARPVFTRSGQELLEEQARFQLASEPALPDLTRWVRVRAADQKSGTALRAQLFDQEDVTRAFHPTYLGEYGQWHRVKRAARQAGKALGVGARGMARSRSAVPEEKGSDQSMNQRYLLSSPWGVGAVDVPGWPGVNGTQAGTAPTAGPPRSVIRIGVIDDYWNKNHRDFGSLKETAEETGWRHRVDDHGTNVIGILFSAHNRHGLVGMALGAQLVFAYPYVRDAAKNVLYSVADAISRATAKLDSGDVLLIERQIEGRAVELSQVCHDAIRHAAAKGIVVVEPAGNGGYDLDKLEELKQPEGGKFVDIAKNDSGAIMVGAGLEASPQRRALHGASANKSFGSRVDVQGYGTGVLTTTGVGRFATAVRGVLKTTNSRGAEDAYTAGFNGTSSASAIVAGAMVVACSVAKALDPEDAPLDPKLLRNLAVGTGSPQSAMDSQQEHIGPQPNLPALLGAIRKELYARHNVPEPDGDKPELESDELRLLGLVASGLRDSDIADLIKLDLPTVQKTWQIVSDKLLSDNVTSDKLASEKGVSEKLGAPRALVMARAGDYWGLL